MTEISLTFIITAFLLLGSPGPVPIALAASGASFGFKKSFGFLIGILSGLAVIIVTLFFGLSSLFEQYPSISIILQIISSLYIIFIAYLIVSASVMISELERDVPQFKEGLILNLINPKAYAALLALISQFSVNTEGSTQSFILASIIIFTIAAFVDTAWLLLGHMLKPLFNHPKYQRGLRYLIALSLTSLAIYSLVKVLI